MSDYKECYLFEIIEILPRLVGCKIIEIYDNCMNLDKNQKYLFRKRGEISYVVGLQFKVLHKSINDYIIKTYNNGEGVYEK